MPMALKGLKAQASMLRDRPTSTKQTRGLWRNGFESVMVSQDPGQEHTISMEN
jgi:hypothetical protein